MIIDKILPLQYWVPVEFWFRSLDFWQQALLALILNLTIVVSCQVASRIDLRSK